MVRQFAKGPIDALKLAGAEFTRLGTQITTGALHRRLTLHLRAARRPPRSSLLPRLSVVMCGLRTALVVFGCVRTGAAADAVIDSSV